MNQLQIKKNSTPTHQEETSTKNPLGTISKRKRTLIYLLFGIGVVAGTSAPFFHKAFDETIYETSPQGIALEKKHADGQIQYAEYAVQKKAIKKSYRYKGFTNKRRFVLAMDDHIAIFIWSLVIIGFSRLVPPVVQGIKIKLIGTIAGFTGMFSSAYFINNNFWWHMTSSDYPDWVYYIGFAFMAFGAATFSFLLIDGWFNKIKIIKTSFVDFLSEIRNIDLRELLGTAIENDMDNRGYQSSIKQASDKLQNKIDEKAKELLEQS